MYPTPHVTCVFCCRRNKNFCMSDIEFYVCCLYIKTAHPILFHSCTRQNNTTDKNIQTRKNFIDLMFTLRISRKLFGELCSLLAFGTMVQFSIKRTVIKRTLSSCTKWDFPFPFHPNTHIKHALIRIWQEFPTPFFHTL